LVTTSASPRLAIATPFSALAVVQQLVAAIPNGIAGAASSDSFVSCMSRMSASPGEPLLDSIHSSLERVEFQVAMRT